MAGGRKNRSTSIGLAQLATGLPLAAHYICTCIYQVGKKLRNCATMYSSRVGEGKYVLVALEHAKNATPVALGGYVVGSGQWEQAQPPCPTPTRLVYMLPHAVAFFSQDNLCPTPHAQVVGMSNRRPETTRQACGSESTARHVLCRAHGAAPP